MWLSIREGPTSLCSHFTGTIGFVACLPFFWSELVVGVVGRHWDWLNDGWADSSRRPGRSSNVKKQGEAAAPGA